MSRHGANDRRGQGGRDAEGGRSRRGGGSGRGTPAGRDRKGGGERKGGGDRADGGDRAGGDRAGGGDRKGSGAGRTGAARTGAARTGGGGRTPDRGGEPPRLGGPAGRRGIVEERIIGGLHPVREVLRSDQAVTRVLISRTRDPVDVLDEIQALAGEREVDVQRHDGPVLDALAEGLVHQGVIALAPPYPYQELEDVLARAGAADRSPLLVALDGVTDPHNLGSIARTAEAVGADALLVPERRNAGVGPAAEKAAAGALAHLPVVRVTNLVRTLGSLHGRGVWSIGLDGDADELLVDHPLASEPCVLVVGAEGRGLSRLTRDRCDALVRLPMTGRVGSLNASVAAGVALYSLLERRR